MLIEWKGAGPLSVHDPRKSSNYKLATVIVCFPGVNKLEDTAWHGTKDHPGLKDNPVFKQYIDDGLIVVAREEDGDADAAAKKGEAPELHGLKPEDAKRVVEQTLNPGLLEHWAETETRPKVKRAIELQLGKLKLTTDSKAQEV